MTRLVVPRTQTAIKCRGGHHPDRSAAQNEDKHGLISERAERRINASIATLGEDPSPRDLIRAVLIEMLPIDDARLVEAHIGVAFGARAAAAPSIATRLREQCAQLLEFLAAQLRVGQQAGQVSAQLDADCAARGLLALIDGLAMHALMQSNTAEQSLAVFDHHLDRVFSGSG